MHSSILRRTSAAMLVATMWTSALIAVPGAYGQTNGTDKTASTDTKKDSKAPSKATPAATPDPAAAKKPLATNEDPSMIGKRNINGSFGDKFFGWLGGSKEKEMQIGRQMAQE
ncbi:MAG: hypothetical protein JO314_12890, partial [Acidobacteria bacterium]|nr:hypothetical protein [Acidobacteriota bacterium]